MADSWLLFPPLQIQERPYPRPSDVHIQLYSPVASTKTCLYTDSQNASPSTSPPAWWDKGRKTVQKRRSRFRTGDQPYSGTGAIDRARWITEEQLGSMAAFTPVIPTTEQHLPSMRSLSLRSSSGVASRKFTPTSQEYDSDDTVVKSNLGRKVSQTSRFTPLDSPDQAVDGSDKENEPPRGDHQLSTNTCSPMTITKPSQVAKQPESRNTSITFQLPLHPRQLSSSSSQYEPYLASRKRKLSYGQSQKSESPSISPRPYLCRYVPSIRLVTTPLPRCPSEERDRFSAFNIQSQMWTSVVSCGNDRVCARHSVVLTLALPRKRWMSDVVVLEFSIKHGPWAESKIEGDVKQGHFELPPTRAPSGPKVVNTLMTLKVPKADLRASIALSVSEA